MMEQSPTTVVTGSQPQPAMQPESCSSKTRYLYYFDIIFGFLVLLASTVFLSLNSVDLKEKGDQLSDKERYKLNATVALHTVAIMFFFIALYIAFLFLKATKNNDPSVALRFAKESRCCHIFFAIFCVLIGSVVLALNNKQVAAPVVYFVAALLHCVEVCIVHKLIQELNKVGQAPMTQAEVSSQHLEQQQPQNQDQGKEFDLDQFDLVRLINLHRLMFQQQSRQS